MASAQESRTIGVQVIASTLAAAVGAVIGTGVLLVVIGTARFNKVEIINQAPAISATGAIVAGSTTQYDYNKFMPLTPLTLTGGKATYSTFYWAYPESYTGSIMEFAIDISTASNSGTDSIVDCGIVAAGSTATGTGLFDNETLTAGPHQKEPGSTEVTIGPLQAVRCAGLVGTGGTTLAGVAYMRYRYTPNN